DAGSSDAGSSDAGPSDAGADAGPSDAGADAGTDAGDPCLGVDCSGSDGLCVVGRCDPATGACVTDPRPDGTSCDADPGDCVSSTCQAGTCEDETVADCTLCDGGVCSAGSCGAAPTEILFSGFEGGAFDAGWTTSGDANWIVTSVRSYGGSFCAQSGDIGPSQSTSLRATLTAPVDAALAFWALTSSESGYDELEVWVDGGRVAARSGTGGDWEPVLVPLSAGAHDIEWRYTKDGSVDSGLDAVWIDEVRLVPQPGFIDFEDGTLSGALSTGGDIGWGASTTQSHGGTWSARSGAIGSSSTSWLRAEVSYAAASTLDFWYRVSSESGYDYLELWIDGSQQDSWSGTVGWTEASYPLAAGAHTIEWRYTKDSSISSGDDAAWVDDIDLGLPPTTGGLCPP
ncbi:MAG TPA: hypothetical protein RMH26_32220, partial [Polyangiaceae bacterium LLY-WYZ-15_(1-7)]|nr:hypothetical protein [Polyangiaceae bacterium LLY-WYZ-15_(1-7)]